MNENYLQRKRGLKGRPKSPWQGLLFGLTLAASIFTGGQQASAQQDVCLGNALQNGGLATTSNGSATVPATIPSWQQTSGSNLRPWHGVGGANYPGIEEIRVIMSGSQNYSTYLYQDVTNARIIDDSITVHVIATLRNEGVQPRLSFYWNSSTSPVATVTLSNTVGSTTYAYAGFNGARVFGNTNTTSNSAPVSVTIRIPVSGITNPNSGTLRIRAEKVSGSGLFSLMSAELHSVFIEENCTPNTSAPLTPFVCGAGYAYITQDYNQGHAQTVEGKTGLYRVNIATGAFDTIKEHLIDTALTQFRQLNALGYNPSDNFIYAQRKGTDQFLRIGADGSYELFRMPGIRSAYYGAADIDSNGIYYLHNSHERHDYIDRIDLNTMTILPPLNVTGIAGNVIDIAVNPRDKFIYVIASETQSGTSYKLQKIDPQTGAVTTLATHTITSGGSFGALWFDSEGNLYGSQNAANTGGTTNGGAIWKFQTVAPYARTNFSLGPITSSNDGARCPYAKIIDKVDISGKVWHDANADAITNNAETGVNPGGNLYATLVNQETGKVIASVLVNPTDGSYLFQDVNAVGIYQVILTDGQKTPGTTLTSADLLPSEWEHTGTNVDGEPNTSNKTGVIADIVTYGEDVTGLDFGVNWNDPVPVVLLSFNANVADNNVRLRWTTVTEQNSKGFDVERSTDAKQWTKVQFVKTKAIDGNSSSELNYEFTDAEVAPGKHYYRLKLIDNDGQYSYSNVRAVVVANGKMSLYPNPASSQVMVSGLTDNAKVAVYDVDGRQVLTSNISPVANAINIGTLPEGVYNVVITDEQGVMNTFKVYKK